MNDACVLLGKPNVYGSIFRFEGQASVFSTPDGPCYRCLFPQPPPPGLVPSCAEGGVLGVLPGLIGTIQATEALKLILGIGDTLVGRLLPGRRARHALPHGEGAARPEVPRLRHARDHGADRLRAHSAACREASMTSGRPTIGEITPRELAERLRRGEDFTLLDVREPYEWEHRAHRRRAARTARHARRRDRRRSTRRSEIVVYCRSGKAQRDAVRQLAAAGFRRVSNLAGGILRWSDDVDPSMPKY